MQLTINKNTLMLALGRSQGIVSKKSTMAILSNILIEVVSSDKFTLTATDLDIFAKGEYDAIIEGNGKICLNAHDLYEWVRSLPSGNITIELVDESNVAITCGNTFYKMPTTNPDDYPEMPDFGEVEYFEMDPKLLSDLSDHTLFSVANDDPRIFLNGVNVEVLENNIIRMVSTDGHRLSLIDRPLDAEFKLEKPIIIPRKGLLELSKLLDEGGDKIEVAFTQSNGFFKTENLLLVMRLIEGDFPDYNMVIPKTTEHSAVLSRKTFAEALKRMSVVSADRSSAVRFKVSSDSIVIESSDPDKGEGRTSLEAVYNGEDVQIGFNAKYFMDAVNVLRGEEIALEISDELSPCVIKDVGDDGFLCVVMPVRIT